LLGLVVAVIAGVTAYRHWRPSATSPASESGLAADDAAGAVPIHRLTPDEMRALARRSPGSAAPATAGDMAEMMEKRKRMAEATQARIQKRNADMSSRFSAEKADPKWSAAHEQELGSLQDSGAMRDAGVKAQNFSASCKTTMCRISADLPSQSAAEDWLQLYMAGVGDSLPVATAHKTVNPDGSVRVEIYGLGRK
jgi:hypothetical protein